MTTWHTPQQRWTDWIEGDAFIEHPVWVSCDEFDEGLRALLDRHHFPVDPAWQPTEAFQRAAEAAAEAAVEAANAVVAELASTSDELELQVEVAGADYDVELRPVQPGWVETPSAPSAPVLSDADAAQLFIPPTLTRAPSEGAPEEAPVDLDERGYPRRGGTQEVPVLDADPAAISIFPDVADDGTPAEGTTSPAFDSAVPEEVEEMATLVRSTLPAEESFIPRAEPGSLVPPGSSTAPLPQAGEIVTPAETGSVDEGVPEVGVPIFDASQVEARPWDPSVQAAPRIDVTERVELVPEVRLDEDDTAEELDAADLVEEPDDDHVEPVSGGRPSDPEVVLGSLVEVAAGDLEEYVDDDRPEPSPASWPDDLFRWHYAAFTRPGHGRLAMAEIDFFVRSAELPAGARVVDIACGDGAHALALAQRGFSVTAFDTSESQLARARKARDAVGVSVDFMSGDMRAPPVTGPFDGAVCLGTSLGYFDDEDNRRAFLAIRDLLAPGGRLLIQVLNRDSVIARLPARSWWQGVGCVVLDEAEMNFFTNRLLVHRTVVFEDGRQFEHDMWIRLYSAHDLGHMCVEAGLRVVEIAGHRCTRARFYGATSPEIWLLVERV